MPRQARLDFPGSLQHLINRGIERRAIFYDAGDYKTFLETLETVVTEGKHRCSAWVLMPNHFHLLVETGTEPISRMMSRLSTRYAVIFNRRHRRSGVLFQNRYKSIVCDQETYFKELVAYIHLNPLRAGLVKNTAELTGYAWSGHQALLGKKEMVWQDVEGTLAHFGETVKKARRVYWDFLVDHQRVRSGTLSGGGLIKSRGGVWEVMRTRKDRDGYDTRVLGEGDFVKSALRQAKEKVPDPVFPEMTLEEAVERVSREMGVSREMIKTPGKSTRKGKMARALLSYMVATGIKKSRTELGDYFGISQPAVSKLYLCGATWAAQNPETWKKLLSK